MLIAWATYLLLLLAIALPVFRVARRRNRPSTIRNVVITALILSLLMAVTSFTSDIMVEQCVAAGNKQCFDPGSTGMLWLMGLGYTGTVWARAWSLRGR